MKKIALLLAAGLLNLAANTYAQRSCDLQVTLTSPADGLEVQAGDTVWMEFTVLNNGGDPIAADDTLWFWDQSRVNFFLAGSEIPANSSKDFTRTDLNVPILAPAQIPADAPAQFCIKLVNQSTISYGNGTGPLVTFEDPDTANNWSCVNVNLKADEPSAIAMSDRGASETLELYPNPASAEVRLDVNFSKAEQVIVSVKDVTGREILRHDYGEIPAGRTSPLLLNTEALKSGIYFVELHTGTQKAIGKLLIQH